MRTHGRELQLCRLDALAMEICCGDHTAVPARLQFVRDGEVGMQLPQRSPHGEDNSFRHLGQITNYAGKSATITLNKQSIAGFTASGKTFLLQMVETTTTALFSACWIGMAGAHSNCGCRPGNGRTIRNWTGRRTDTKKATEDKYEENTNLRSYAGIDDRCGLCATWPRRGRCRPSGGRRSTVSQNAW